MRQPKLLDYLLLILLALIWASAFFNIKIATYSFGPVTIAFLRVFFGAIPVLLLCYYKNIKIEAFSKDWHWFAMIGFINLVAPFFLILFNDAFLSPATKQRVNEFSVLKSRLLTIAPISQPKDEAASRAVLAELSKTSTFFSGSKLLKIF